MNEYPKYVKMGKSYFRLMGNSYWRDGGEWGVGFKTVVDPSSFSFKLVSVSDMSHINNKVLEEATEEEYINDNIDYIPTGYTLETGEKWDRFKKYINKNIESLESNITENNYYLLLAF